MINALNIQKIAHILYQYRIPLLPHLCTLLIFLLYNSKISHKTKIGKKTVCVYGGIRVLIHEQSQIGKECSIGAGVKIVGKSPYKNLPIIGDRVFIGSGVVIMGPVIIEDNVIIAANSVVTKSVKENSIVGGIPAKILGSVTNLGYDILKNEVYLDGYIGFM